MNKEVPVIAFVLLFAAVALAAAAQNAPVGTMKIRVTAEQANLREKPDIGSGIVQQIPEGTVLEADKKEGEWFFVRYALEDGGVIGGYIHESLVEVVEGAVAPAGAKPAVKEQERVRTTPPGELQSGIGRIEKPDFSTGSFPLEFTFSAGFGAIEPHDLSDGAKGFAASQGAGLGIPAPREAAALSVAFLAGIEFSYRFSPRLAIGFGADYLSGVNGDDIVFSEGVVTETIKTRPAARAVPVKLVARFYPGAGFYFRGGLCVYAVKATYLYRIDRPDETWQQWKGTATTSALGVEAAFGGEWKAATKTWVFAEADFRFARFGGLTGKDVYTDSSGTNVSEPGTLTFFREEAVDGNAYPHLFVRESLPTGEGITDARHAVVNLSGVTLRAGIRYRF